MKIFSFNENLKGTLISEPNKVVGVITGSTPFKRQSKGYGIQLSSGNSVQWTIDSSTITNLVSLATGNGTLRISCGANNTDITITGDEYNNSEVSFSDITTITITATSGTVYLYGLQVFNVVSTDELNKIQEQFLQASPTEKEIRGFEYPEDYADNNVLPYIIEDFSNHPVGDTNPKGWNKGTGAFVIGEDVNGKYLECTSNGTIKLRADLDSFTDNGYIEIDRYDGSSWTTHADTVSDLASESWFDYSNKEITLTATTGDRFTNLNLYNEIKL